MLYMRVYRLRMGTWHPGIRAAAESLGQVLDPVCPAQLPSSMSANYA